MKLSIKLLSLLLSLLMLLTCFVACGGADETEQETEGKDTTSETETEKETEDPRQSVKVDLPADLSFANAADNTITFFTRDDKDLWKYEMDVDEITNDTLWDSIYARNAKVESLLGVKIQTISQLGSWSNRNTWNETLRSAVNTKSGDFDAAAVYMASGSALVVEGMYYNLVDFPNITLSKPWWNQAIQEETTLFDSLYFLAGDIAISETAGGGCMFFNKTMFEALNPEDDLYQTVWDGNWTIDKLYDYVEGAWADVNSNGVTDNGDIVGINQATIDTTNDGGMDLWITAMGLRLTTLEDGIPVLSFYNERSIAAYEKVQNLYANNVGTLVGSGNNDSSFAAGMALFARGNLNSGSNFRDMAQPYGVVPLPKFDENQEAYYTSADDTVSLVVVLSSTPVDKIEMVGATLEHMAAESYKTVTPTYYEVVLKSKYSNDPRDAEMYDSILESFVYTFGFIYSALSIGNVGKLFRNLTLDFAQEYQANSSAYQTALEKLIDKLDELSFAS